MAAGDFAGSVTDGDVLVITPLDYCNVLLFVFSYKLKCMLENINIYMF